MYIADAENKRVQAFHIQTLALVAEGTSLDVADGWTLAIWRAQVMRRTSSTVSIGAYC